MKYPILRNIKAIKCCVLKVMSYIIEKCLLIDMGPWEEQEKSYLYKDEE